MDGDAPCCISITEHSTLIRSVLKTMGLDGFGSFRENNGFGSFRESIIIHSSRVDYYALSDRIPREHNKPPVLKSFARVDYYAISE